MIECLVAAYFPIGQFVELKTHTIEQKSCRAAAQEFATKYGLEIIAEMWEQPTEHGKTRSFATLQGVRIWVYAQEY